MFISYICTGFATLCFILGEISKLWSQVDKIWSITPGVYCWVVTYKTALANENVYDPRQVLMSLLVTLWGIRLTGQFVRKEGYSWKFWAGEEDYRWEILRKKPEFQVAEGKWNWKHCVFHLLFISFYQHFLLLSITLPLIKITSVKTQLFWADYLLVFLMVLVLFGETISDEQQWAYQMEKKRQREAGTLSGVYKIGFLHSGLFKYCRHPAYFCEQSVWVILYFFSVAATAQ